jgi:hypothetical protein
LQLEDISVRPITKQEVSHYNDLMQAHHYLGASRPIGETLRYVALYQKQWVALISFSSAALKCAARDQWIGWSYRHQFDRLNLVTNNSRFLILPQWHYPNLASRTLSLCQKRLPVDWIEHFHHPLLLLETFVDPAHFQGTLYKAANWQQLGMTQGYSRLAKVYQANSSPKMIFVYALQRNAQRLLSKPVLTPNYQYGVPKLMLTADQMKTLPELFSRIADPRRAQGRRHRLSTILAIATGAILCGRVGYKGIAEWAQSLGQDARGRFNCSYKQGAYKVPSESAIRNVLIKISPEALDHALRQWSARYALHDESLAIDGKTMRSAIDSDGKQTHIMSAIGHQSLACYTQKKLVNCA